jgi:hypothetical protein
LNRIANASEQLLHHVISVDEPVVDSDIHFHDTNGNYTFGDGISLRLCFRVVRAAIAS